MIKAILGKYLTPLLFVLFVLSTTAAFFGGKRVESWKNDSARLEAVREYKKSIEAESVRLREIAGKYEQLRKQRRQRHKVILERIEVPVHDPSLCPPVADSVLRDINTLRGYPPETPSEPPPALPTVRENRGSPRPD